MKTESISIQFITNRSLRLSVLTLLFSSLLLSCNKSKNEYDASGTFESTEVIVSAESSGKILSLNIEEGQILKRNEAVGTIDSIQLYLKKQQLLSSGKAMQSRRPNVEKQIAAIKEQISTAIKERKRVENLLRANAANQKQLDDVKSQISILERQLDAQKTSLETNNQGITDESTGVSLQVEQMEDQLNKCIILSPIDGTVLVKYAEVGEVAIPGKALFKIANTENMILRAYLTGDQLTKLKVGQKIKVYADFGASSTREYSGQLAWISSKSEFTPKTIQTRDERANLVYAIKINVKNDGYLKIGQYGNIKLESLSNQ
jgi:HlyD family secretion protein